MAVYEETIDLKDGISATAKSASSQVRILEDAIKSTQNAMVKAGATGNVSQYKKLTKDLEAYKATLGTLPPAMSEASAATSQMTSGAGGLQAELAEVTGGLSVVVEAAAAVGAAFGAVVLAGMAMSLEAVEAKEKMLSLFDALGNGKTSGAETVAMLDQLGNRIGRTRKELAPMAQQFMAMGVTSLPALEKAITANASAMAMMGEGGAAAFEKVMKQIQLAAATGGKMKNPLKAMASLGLEQGQAVADAMGIPLKTLQSQIKSGTVDAKQFGDALQDALIKKGAGPLAKAGMSLTNVWAKFQENISKLFEDVEVGPFLEQIKSLFDIFGSGKDIASGKALKAGVGGFFKDVFAVAAKVVPYVKHFLLDLVIYGLKAYIALKPIAKSFNEWRTSASGMKTISTVFSVIASVLITVATVIGVAIGAFVALWAVMVGIGVVIWAFIAAVIAIPQQAGAALADFFGKAPQMAKDFIMGLVDGIKNGAGMVVDAVKGMASGAVDSFKGALGIHSPSRVMMQMGGHVASGAAAGIDDGAPDVHGASADLAKAAAGGFASGGAAPAAPGASGSGGGVNVTLEAGAIVIQGGNGASIVDLTEQAVALLFERIALQQGLG